MKQDYEEDGSDFQTLQYYNYHLLQQQQENMRMQNYTNDFNPCYDNSTDQAALITRFSPFGDPPPPYISPFLMPPPPYSYGGSFSDQHVDVSMSGLTDHDQAMIGSSSLAGHEPSSSSLFSNMRSDEYEKMRSIDMMEAKALAASRSHSEAERRRRERINGHLAKLRSLLPNTTKTDKASLLTEVIQHVKDLKQQTSTLSDSSTVPSEHDELTFEACNAQDGGQLLVKASLCCEDRPDLLQDLSRTLKLFKLRAVKANLSTLGDRMKILLIIMGDDGETTCQESDACISDNERLLRTVQEALRGVLGRSVTNNDSKSVSVGNCKAKRQRFKGVDYR